MYKCKCECGWVEFVLENMKYFYFYFIQKQPIIFLICCISYLPVQIQLIHIHIYIQYIQLTSNLTNIFSIKKYLQKEAALCCSVFQPRMSTRPRDTTTTTVLTRPHPHCQQEPAQRQDHHFTFWNPDFLTPSDEYPGLFSNINNI